jgi:uncharacterized protein YjbJ (UPF0337 family)
LNIEVLQGRWKQIRGRVTEQWGDITDRDLDKIQGKREQLVGLVQEKYGYTKGKAGREVDVFLKKVNLRPASGNHAFGILAVFMGSLLTIAVIQMLARRQQASA